MATHTVYKTKDGHRVPATTTITGVMNKPALIKWANDLGKRGIDTKDYVDSLAKIGTLAHYMIECDCIGRKPDLTPYSQDQINLAENSYLKWLYWRDSVQFKPFKNEWPMVSEQHKFGGKVDIIGYVNEILTLIDIKTAKGIFGEHWTQVAGGYSLLCYENHVPIKDVMIVRVGRNEEEGFEALSATQDEIDLHQKRFLVCRELYELNKVLDTY